MKLGSMPINWFDFAFVIILVVGLMRGRKRGMSSELLVLLQWLAIVFAGAMLYGPAGQMLAGVSMFSLLFANVVCYLGIALIIKLVFVLMNRSIGGKLIGSDVFGSSEYYLGMISGMIRFFCILMASLALLNAKLTPKAESLALAKMQQENFGDITLIPTIDGLQKQVFENSLCGGLIKKHLDFLLIKPTKSESKKITRREFEMP